MPSRLSWLVLSVLILLPCSVVLPSSVVGEEFLACTKKELPSEHWNQLFTQVLHELVGDDCAAFLGVAPTVRLSTSMTPAAYSSDEVITVSHGLLKILEDRSEMAFVLAHELGHIVLHHQHELTTRSALDGSFRPLDTLIQREIEADSFALDLMRRTNFSPNSGRNLLIRLASDGETLPSIQRRLKAMH